MKKLSLVLALSVGLLLLFSGCDNLSTESDEPSQSEIEEAILAIVNADSTTSLDGFFDQDDYAPDYSYDQGGLLKISSPQDTLPNDLPHIRFGRRLTGDFQRTVDVNIVDDTAYVSITTQFDAEFRVVFIDTSDTSGELPDPVVKPFTATSLQNLKLLRFRHTRNPRLNWRIIAVSPRVIFTENTPIYINSITLSTDGNTVFSLTNDDSSSVLNLWIDRDNLPVLHQGDTLHLVVGVENPDPFYYDPGELCFLNMGVHRRILRFRRLLFDPENDNTFERNVRVHRRVPVMCRLFIDLIDYRSIFDTEAPFYNFSIGFPYRVRR